jgi:hypothetical protein
MKGNRPVVATDGGGRDGHALTERHWQLLRLLQANSRRDQAGRLVSRWSQADKDGKPRLATKLGIKPRQLRNILADLREPGSNPRHPTKQPPGRRLGWVKVEPTTYRDKATGRHRLGVNVYVVTEAGQRALAEHDQQAMVPEPVSAGHVNRQWPAVAGLNKRNPASKEKKVSSPSSTAFSNPRRAVRPVAASDHPPNPCGWDDCTGCAAVVSFEAKWRSARSGRTRP